MTAVIKEATVSGRTQGMDLNILEHAEKASGVRVRCATVGHAMVASVNRLKNAKKAKGKRHHLDMDTRQALTAMSMHLL